MLTAIAPPSRRIKDVSREDDALLLRSEYGILEISFKEKSIARVRFTVSGSFSEKERPGVTGRDNISDWTYRECDGSIEASTEKLTVKIRKDSGSVSFFDSKGIQIFKERDYSFSFFVR